MRPAFNADEYAAGHAFACEALREGLSRQPPESHAGSWVIGAYCAMIQLVWQNRATGSDRIHVGGVLAAVAADVLNEEARDWTAGEPVAVLVDAFNIAAKTCSPGGEDGRPHLNGDHVLAAAGALAAQMLATVPDHDARAARRGDFVRQVDRVLVELGVSEAKPASGDASAAGSRVVVIDDKRRALSTSQAKDAQIVRLREVLLMWTQAFRTGRNEPLHIAFDVTLRTLERYDG